MIPGVKVLFHDVLSTLLPRPCPLCRKVLLKEQEGFCPDCFRDFNLIHPPLCMICGEPLKSARDQPPTLCPPCLSNPPGQSPSPLIRSCAMYTGHLRQGILKVKYGCNLPMAASMGLFLQSQYQRLFPVQRFDIILPVPVHPRRLRERGFNQCLLFARPLAKHLRLPLDLSSVQRIRYAASQSSSRLEERRRNLREAFHVSQRRAVKGKIILIVDDVYTTGATLEALSQALFFSGARKVAALTLARSPSPADIPLLYE